MMYKNPNTAKAIKRLRYALGLKQSELASKLDVSLSAIKQWESGRNRPNPTHYKRIIDLCAQYGYTIDDTDRLIGIPVEHDRQTAAMLQRMGGTLIL